MTDVKNKLEGINSRLFNTEEWISDQEGRIMEIAQSEKQNRKKNLKTCNSMRDLMDKISLTAA